MVQPINYGVEIADPTQAFLGAFQAGASIQDARLKQEQQTQQQANQALIQQGFAKLRGPGATTEDVANLAMMLPKDQSESVLKAWTLKTDAQKQNSLLQSGKVVSALFAGENDIAAQLINDQAAAMRNSGNEEGAKFLETWRGITEINPAATQNFFTAQLLQLPGGKDIVDNIIKLRTSNIAEAKAPSELREQVAKADKAVSDATVAQATATNAPAKAKADADLAAAQATKAEVDAEFARAKAVLDVQQQAATLRKTDADILIAQENNRIAALNAAQAKETNVLRRQELQQKIDDAKEKRDAADRDQRATLANQSADIDNFINTATRIKQTPKDIINAATGPIASRLPTTSQGVADFEALVETLGSQAFLAQIPKIKGTGNLTEKEGDKLQASLQNLSLKQSPDRLLANVDEAVRLLEKARVTITARSGLPAMPSDVPARELNVTVGGTTYNFPTKAAADAFRNSDAYRRAAGNR